MAYTRHTATSPTEQIWTSSSTSATTSMKGRRRRRIPTFEDSTARYKRPPHGATPFSITAPDTLSTKLIRICRPLTRRTSGWSPGTTTRSRTTTRVPNPGTTIGILSPLILPNGGPPPTRPTTSTCPPSPPPPREIKAKKKKKNLTPHPPGDLGNLYLVLVLDPPPVPHRAALWGSGLAHRVELQRALAG